MVSHPSSSGYNTMHKRQAWNEPGSTVQMTFGMIFGCKNAHPIATKPLTIRSSPIGHTVEPGRFDDDLVIGGRFEPEEIQMRGGIAQVKGVFLAWSEEIA